MRYLWAVLLLMSCLLVGETNAATRYASPGGGGDCSSGNPCSLNTAMNSTPDNSGDTIYLKGGTYNQGIFPADHRIPHGSNWSNAITIASAPGETATLTGCLCLQGNFDGSTPAYLIFDRLHIDRQQDGSSTVETGNAVRMSAGVHHIKFQYGEARNATSNLMQITSEASSIEILYNNIHHAYVSLFGGAHPTTGNYGLYYNASDGVIEGNLIHDNTGYGLHLYNSGASNVNNNIIRNNRFYANGSNDGERGQVTGAMILSSGNNNLAYNNLVYNNYGNGIQVDLNAAGTLVYNNTIYGNTRLGMDIGLQGKASGTVVRNNIIHGNGSQIETGVGDTTYANNLCGSSGTGCDSALTGDPGFVLAGADFHIALAGSKAVNCCPRIGSVTTDLEGANRSNPTTAGAYEFNGSIPPPTPDPDQMLGRLKFDEGSGTNAADSTGNNHFCTLTSPGWVSPGILYGSAFSLDGTRSCQIAGTDGLATPDMTVAVWIKGSVLPGPGELGCLFTIGDTFQLCVQPGGSAYFNVITDTYHTLSSPSNVQDGVARLITGVYGPSAGEGQRLYVNEAQVSFLAATGNLTYPYGTLSQVGRYFTSGPYAYNGVIQDVMVFNYALDQTAVANIYNSRIPAVNVFSPHMAWVSGTTSAVLAIDTAMNHRIEEPIAVRSTIANSGPEITEFFRLAVCNVVDCDADSDWLEVKPTVNALGVYLDADPSVGLTSNTLQNLNGDGFAYNVGRYVTHIPVVLEWDASADPQVVGYKVHYGTAPGIYTQVYDAGASLTATITGLDLGLTYYFAATAYRADLIESDFSSEVSQSLRNVTTLATGVLTEWEYRRVRFTTPAQIGHQFKFRMLRESSLPLTTYNNTPILTLTGTLIGPPLDFVSGGGSFSGTSNR